MKTHTVGGKIRDRFSLTPLVMKYGVAVKLENVNYFSGKQRLRSTFVDIPTATEKTIEEFIRSLTFVSQNYIFHYEDKGQLALYRDRKGDYVWTYLNKTD